ncbi:NADH-quinone oxidoreductase subunit A [Aggregatilinea lenta]|uniref:NADH-quinone oxidoreductase subunit A n=1 Tax=Aggregatilinea lenta TaxID=913108 RepID=UPI000E5BB0B8|nr:NADH-quinone oxidoreductase subunit A [Aggregatilinea lenta]
MLSDFAPIAALLILSVAVSFLIVFMSRLFGPFHPADRKLSPYESGMKPFGPAMRRIPVRFYRVAVLFILFDIEVIFFIPWAVIFRDLAWYGLAVIGVFFFILTVGFVYEWKVGGLEWE